MALHTYLLKKPYLFNKQCSGPRYIWNINLNFSHQSLSRLKKKANSCNTVTRYTEEERWTRVSDERLDAPVRVIKTYDITRDVTDADEINRDDVQASA